MTRDIQIPTGKLHTLTMNTTKTPEKNIPKWLQYGPKPGTKKKLLIKGKLTKLWFLNGNYFWPIAKSVNKTTEKISSWAPRLLSRRHPPLPLGILRPRRMWRRGLMRKNGDTGDRSVGFFICGICGRYIILQGKPQHIVVTANNRYNDTCYEVKCK